MKKIFTLVLIVMLTVNLFAQVPQKMSYQSVVRDTAGKLVLTHAVGLQISILKGNANGNAVFVETHNLSTNANGLMSLEIGGGTQVGANSFASINWSTGPYFIKTETDPTGGTNYTISGTSELLSVPYALFAANGGVTGPQGPPGIGGFAHYIGELFGGGIVANVWKEAGVEHALIASLNDLSTGIAWSNLDTTLIGPTASSAINGQTNTTAIIAQAGHTTSPAALCDAYTAGGFSDWYLPSIWELEKFFISAFEINTALENDGNNSTVGFQQINDPYYWSSTEGGNTSAWNQNFNSGHASNSGKNWLYLVRAVRRI